MTVVLPAPVASFSAEAHQLGIGVAIRVGEVVQEGLARFAGVLWGNLRQPDQRLNGLDLAEERANAAELVVTPMLQEPRGLRRDAPFRGIRPVAPTIDVDADLIDDRRRIVLLLLRGKALALVKHKLGLVGLARRFFGWDEPGVISADRRLVEDAIGRLTVTRPAPNAGRDRRRGN